MNYPLEVIKVKAPGFKWAIRATVNGVSRYRGYHYQAEAIRNMETWAECEPGYFKDREFRHNFNSAEEIGITCPPEVIDD